MMGMSAQIDWMDIAIRMGLTLVAGSLASIAASMERLPVSGPPCWLD